MKAIEQAAKECAEKMWGDCFNATPDKLEEAFKAGAAFAQEWISVEDELPPICIEASEENILLLRNKIDGITLGYRKIYYWYSQLGILTFDTVTHWRQINRK